MWFVVVFFFFWVSFSAVDRDESWICGRCEDEQCEVVDGVDHHYHCTRGTILPEEVS